MAIHPTAVIDSSAELDSTVEVGAYAIIEGGTQIGAETRIFPHGYICRGARIGRRCEIHPFAVVAGAPQDHSYDGSPSYARIGDDATVREGVTIHRGTEPQSVTVLGERCLVMTNTHVGHNCEIGDDVTIAHGAVLGGRVTIQNRATIGGMCGLHQFCRIGELAMISGGNLRVTADVPPFMMLGPDGLVGPNTIGLKRAGFSDEERREIRECYRTLFRSSRLLGSAIDLLEKTVRTDPGRRLIAFLKAPAKRTIARAPRGRTRSESADAP